MKYLILSLALILAGCTDHDGKIIDGLERLQKETQLNLQSCQNSLSMYRNSGTSTQEETTPEPEAKPEPQCEDIDYQIITQNGKKLDVCLASSVEAAACGVSASDCESGQGYSCLRDVSYKTVTKKKCE